MIRLSGLIIIRWVLLLSIIEFTRGVSSVIWRLLIIRALWVLRVVVITRISIEVSIAPVVLIVASLFGIIRRVLVRVVISVRRLLLVVVAVVVLIVSLVGWVVARAWVLIVRVRWVGSTGLLVWSISVGRPVGRSVRRVWGVAV